MKIKEKLIKLLGGYTQQEFEDQKYKESNIKKLVCSYDNFDILPIQAEISINKPNLNDESILDVYEIKEQLARCMVTEIKKYINIDVNLRSGFNPDSIVYRGVLNIIIKPDV